MAPLPTMGQSRAGILVAAIGLLILLHISGCASAISTGHVLQPGDTWQLRVEGSRPYMEIRNQGPGDVRVIFGSHRTDRFTLLPGSFVNRTLLSPEIQIENYSQRQAIVSVEAHNASGYFAEQATAAEQH